MFKQLFNGVRMTVYVLFTLVAVCCFNLEVRAKGIDLIGGICDFINELNTEKRMEKAAIAELLKPSTNISDSVIKALANSETPLAWLIGGDWRERIQVDGATPIAFSGEMFGDNITFRLKNNKGVIKIESTWLITSSDWDRAAKKERLHKLCVARYNRKKPFVYSEENEHTRCKNEIIPYYDENISTFRTRLDCECTTIMTYAALKAALENVQ